MSTSTISVDEFQALEQKVLRAVEIVKREREARAAAEAEVASLREQLASYREQYPTAIETELTTLNKERDAVRQSASKRCSSRWTNSSNLNQKETHGPDPRSPAAAKRKPVRLPESVICRHLRPGLPSPWHRPRLH